MDKNKFNFYLKNLNKKQRYLEEIYLFYFPKIVIHINRKFNKQISGEDIAQDFFIKLKNYSYKDFIESPISWIYKISENIAYDKLRKQKKALVFNEAINNDLEFCFEQLDFIYEFNCLKEKLKIFDIITQRIIYLVYWEGYNLKEISLMLNTNYSTIKQKHNRCLKKLKKILK